MKELLLYSGGMDSLIAWEYLKRPDTLYVNLGHVYNIKELIAIQRTIPTTTVIDLLSIGKYEKADAEIPARNLLLALVAALEGADLIHLIIQKDEMSIPDRTTSFLKTSGKLLSDLMGRKITISTPFTKIDKTEMVKWYKEGGYDLTRLIDTVGCYSNRSDITMHCGNCGACLRRYISLKNNGIEPWYRLSNRIKQEYLAKIGTYSPERQKRMKKWLTN